jgi:hypothetical protein
MKKVSVLLIIIFSINITAQQQSKEPVFRWVSFGVFAGPSFTSAPKTGYSVSFEGQVRIIPHVNLKLSLGYSLLNQDKIISVKTYRLQKNNGAEYYQTQSFDMEINNYKIFPFSAGCEYSILEGDISPYITFEIGTNIYSTGVNYSNHIIGSLQEYNSSQDVPAGYRSGQRIVLGHRSIRTAAGFGTKIKIYGNLNFEIRYLYDINSAIINSHRLLMGFSI